MKPIRSTALRAADYDPARRILTVQFRKDGSVYAIFRVSPPLYLELLANQPHPWTKVGPRLMRHHKVYLGKAA
jgi:hypothetical protein